MACTKPKCNCWEIAVEKANGEYPKHGYPCLYEDNSELGEPKQTGIPDSVAKIKKLFTDNLNVSSDQTPISK